MIREVIRQIILQEALRFDTPEELAMVAYWDGSNTSYIFFRFKKAMDYINKTLGGDNYVQAKELAYGLVYGEMQDQVIGGIRLHRPFKTSHWGAAEIKLVAAEQGWGPTLYDTVMGEEPNGIMADRREVSQEAYKIYDYYLQYRDDIEKKPLDSEKHKWTEDTFDDGQPGSGGRYNRYANLESQEQFLEDATSWVYNRDSVPQAIGWKKNGKIIEDLLSSHFEDSDINKFFFHLMSFTYDYYSYDE